MYEEETEQLKKVMKDHGTPKSVPLTCDKCNYESEVSFKEWEKHWHGVEFKCPKCSHVIMKNDATLQTFGVHSGVISKNEKTSDAICENCGHDSQKTWNEMDKHRWGVEYRCPECNFEMFKDKPNLYKMASEEGLVDYPLKEKANAYFWIFLPIIVVILWMLISS
jgi:predicted RNA-binding Zn-ribbon protein involved in translation (DUF1610 family)